MKNIIGKKFLSFSTRHDDDDEDDDGVGGSSRKDGR